jgi:DNA-binding MarR family transcriptional regulator
VRKFNFFLDKNHFCVIIVQKMNNSLQDRLFKPSERMRDLQLLEEIEQNPRISQRELSSKFGIALGVTNACIKRMARRGLIRLKGFPPRRIAYYLTPKGFAEKSKLTLRFLSYNVRHYAEMKKMISKKLFEMQENGVKRIVFYGVCDEMEIAYITLQGVNIQLIGIVDDGEDKQGIERFGYRVQGPDAIHSMRPDVLLITSLTDAEKILEGLRKRTATYGIHVERL